MRIVTVLAAPLAAVMMMSCGSEQKPPAKDSAPKAEAPSPKPSDESRRFPKADLVETKVVDRQLLGKTFMPGGTLATYKKGKTEYEMFVARMPSPTDAAILLLDWKKELADARLVPSFGGYSGQDSGRPVFVFSKGSWIAGVAGLPQKQADAQARLLAAELD